VKIRILRSAVPLVLLAIALGPACGRKVETKIPAPNADASAPPAPAPAEKGVLANAAEKGAALQGSADDVVANARRKAGELETGAGEWARLGNERLAAVKEKLGTLGLAVPTLGGDRAKDKAALETLLAGIAAQAQSLETAAKGLSVGKVSIPPSKDIEAKRAALEDAGKAIQPILEAMGKAR